jgi:proteasome accessory factor C
MPKSKSLSGADRYNFMLALTGYLITHRQQKISELANHFDVTEKEISSAVVTISLSGVGRYRPDELFFLDYDLLEEGIVDLSFAPTLESVPRLSTRQAAAIASGLAFMAEVVSIEDRAEISELLEVLGSGVLKSSELPFSVQPAKPDPELASVRNAIALRKVIRAEYINNSGEISKREIEPLILESRDSIWYLRGFCRTNKEIRVFRVDRMREIELLDETVLDNAGSSLGSTEIYSVGDNDTEVLFEVQPEAFSLIADYKPDYEISGNKPIQLKIPIGQLSNLGRIVARYSGSVEVLAPEEARIAIRDFAASALGKKRPEVVAE